MDVVQKGWGDDGRDGNLSDVQGHGPRVQRGGSGEQQQIQPRQTDDESGLFELGVVRNKRDNVEVKVERKRGQ
jgi:hypothetical protein